MPTPLLSVVLEPHFLLCASEEVFEQGTPAHCAKTGDNIFYLGPMLLCLKDS